MVRKSYMSMGNWWNNAEKRNRITLKNICASANSSTPNLTSRFIEVGFRRLGNMIPSIGTLS